MNQEEGSELLEKSKRPWAKRLGWAAILFFTIKGLLWLIIPAVAAWYIID